MNRKLFVLSFALMLTALLLIDCWRMLNPQLQLSLPDSIVGAVWVSVDMERFGEDDHGEYQMITQPLFRGWWKKGEIKTLSLALSTDLLRLNTKLQVTVIHPQMPVQDQAIDLRLMTRRLKVVDVPITWASLIKRKEMRYGITGLSVYFSLLQRHYMSPECSSANPTMWVSSIRDLLVRVHARGHELNASLVTRNKRREQLMTQYEQLTSVWNNCSGV